MHRGYIALWRKIKDHPFATEPREFSKYEAWIDLLMEAQHEREPQRVIIGMNVLECHYGECLKSVTTWADRWKWSRSKVFRFLKLLKKMDQIHYASETVTTRIKIINYESYDPRRNGKKTEEEHERNASETQAVTDNNVKNVKNKNLSSSDDEVAVDGIDFLKTKRKRKLNGKRWEAFQKFWDVFGYKKGKREAADAWLDIPELTNTLVDQILSAAKKEADRRPQLIADGKTPKMAQGWISASRWEDEEYTPPQKERRFVDV